MKVSLGISKRLSLGGPREFWIVFGIEKPLKSDAGSVSFDLSLGDCGCECESNCVSLAVSAIFGDTMFMLMLLLVQLLLIWICSGDFSRFFSGVAAAEAAGKGSFFGRIL